MEKLTLNAKITEFRGMIKQLKAVVYGKLHRRHVERIHKKRCSELEMAKRKRKAEKILEQMKALRNEDVDNLTHHILLNFGQIKPIDNEQLVPVDKVRYMMVYWAMKDKALADVIQKFHKDYPDFRTVLEEMNTDEKFKKESSKIADCLESKNKSCDINVDMDLSKKRALNQRRKRKQKLRKRALYEALQTVASDTNALPADTNALHGSDNDITPEVTAACENGERKGNKRKSYPVDKRLLGRRVFRQKLREAKQATKEERKAKVAKKKLLRRQAKLMEIRKVDVIKDADFSLQFGALSGHTQSVVDHTGSVLGHTRNPLGYDSPSSHTCDMVTAKKPMSSFFIGGGDDEDVNEENDRSSSLTHIQNTLVGISEHKLSESLFDKRPPHQYNQYSDESKQRRIGKPRADISKKSTGVTGNTLHPSWQAKRISEQKSMETSFQGKRIKFTDDDD